MYVRRQRRELTHLVAGDLKTFNPSHQAMIPASDSRARKATHEDRILIVNRLQISRDKMCEQPPLKRNQKPSEEDLSDLSGNLSRPLVYMCTYHITASTRRLAGPPSNGREKKKQPVFPAGTMGTDPRQYPS